MLEIETLDQLREGIQTCIQADKKLLEDLCVDVRRLRTSIRRIHPHSTTAISLVGTDGGNNQLRFDPFMVQLVRVVDSSNNEYCLEAVTPRTRLDLLHQRHFDSDGRSASPLGRMMDRLKASSLDELSVMIPRPPTEPKPSWVQVYRELTEWAVLLDLIETKDFATDTIIIRDGFLRSKVFAGYLFRDFRRLLEEAIENHYRKNKRRIYVAGIAKHSKVLQTYRLAMAIEGVLRSAYAAYVEVPREMEERVYKWSEYARGDEREVEGQEGNRFVAGKMFWVKFGGSPHDPVWAIDLLLSQTQQAPEILGYMLEDALDGFPVPFYPQCLQRAHENAALVDFDMDILQDQILEALKAALADKAELVEEFRLQVGDPAAARYR